MHKHRHDYEIVREIYGTQNQKKGKQNAEKKSVLRQKEFMNLISVEMKIEIHKVEHIRVQLPSDMSDSGIPCWCISSVQSYFPFLPY